MSAVAFLVVVVDDGGGGVGGSGGSISLSMGSQDSFVVVVDDLFCVVHAAVNLSQKHHQDQLQSPLAQQLM